MRITRGRACPGMCERPPSPVIAAVPEQFLAKVVGRPSAVRSRPGFSVHGSGCWRALERRHARATGRTGRPCAGEPVARNRNVPKTGSTYLSARPSTRCSQLDHRTSNLGRSKSARPAGFEPATHCLEGTSLALPDVGRYGLICRLAAAIMAGRGLVKFGICGCWLPGLAPSYLVSMANVRVIERRNRRDHEAGVDAPVRPTRSGCGMTSPRLCFPSCWTAVCSTLCAQAARQ
jgi:hypothetical protein